MLICSNEEFNLNFIKEYINKLKDEKVENQKIFIMCIRNFDYNILYNYILERFGENNE